MSGYSWIILAVTFFFLFWLGILEVISRAGGWKRVGQRYAATSVPEGRRFSMQHIAFGWVDYNGCLTIIVAPEGIFLSLWQPFRFSHPNLLIPWSVLHVLKVKATGWTKEVKLAIEEPALAKVKLPYKIVEAAQELLPAWKDEPAAESESN
jgi:hypothetical protein